MTRKQVEFKLSCYFILDAYKKTGNEVYLMALNEPPRQVDITEEQIADIEAFAKGFHKWKSIEQFHQRLTQLQEVELVGRRSRSTNDMGAPTIKGVKPSHTYAWLEVSAKLERLAEAAKPNGWRLIELRLTPKVRKRRDDLGRWYEVAETESFGQLNRNANYSTLNHLARAYYAAIARIAKEF